MSQQDNLSQKISEQVLPLQKLQQSFMKHLLNAPSEVDKQIQSTNEATAQQRLSIYATGYRLRLKEAITTDFDCLHGYLGDEMFEKLMDCYIDQYQSQHTSLRYYSQHITELLKKQKPFSEHPELVEIAKIEQTFNDSFDAENCNVLKIEELAQIAEEAWPTLQLKFHASVHLLDCKFNSFEIWKALSKDKTPPALLQENTTWLIWRKDLVSRYRALNQEETFALTQAINGNDFSEICEGLLGYFNEEETPMKAVRFLQLWINEMMVCDTK